MQRSFTSSIEEYESKFMQLNLSQVSGEVFIIDPSFSFRSIQNFNQSQSYESHNQTSLSKSNLLIDLNESQVIFEHMEESRTDVQYENIKFADILGV